MRTIHKYPVPQTATFSIEMPVGANIIHLGEQQNDGLNIWAEVETDNPPELRKFKLIGTGHIRPIDGRHVGSAIVPPFVWHLYEAVEEDDRRYGPPADVQQATS